jgi:hypothetical protein
MSDNCPICGGLPHNEVTSPCVKAQIISGFVEQVERKAEEKMLRTGKLEGAHYAAMKELAAGYKPAVREESKTVDNQTIFVPDSAIEDYKPGGSLDHWS